MGPLSPDRGHLLPEGGVTGPPVFALVPIELGSPVGVSGSRIRDGLPFRRLGVAGLWWAVVRRLSAKRRHGGSVYQRRKAKPESFERGISAW